MKIRPFSGARKCGLPFKIEVTKLSAGHKHPMGYAQSGFYGLYVNGELIYVEETFECIPGIIEDLLNYETH